MQGNHRYTINSARSFTPAIPRILPPHQTWAGSFAGNGAVPHNRQIYIGFGTFTLDTRPQSVSTSQAIVIR
jgi:hypothetical protein